MLEKEFPILEFDDSDDVYISPILHRKDCPKVSENLIICFFHEVLNKLIEEKEIVFFFEIKGENSLKIYRHRQKNYCVMPGMVGGTACGGYLDIMIALGSKNILFCGGGGSLHREITVGKFVVIDSAVRDEGMSYHYAAPSREIESNPEMRTKIIRYLEKNQFDYITGKAWTTDAFYRETKKKAQLRKEEGCLIVEMEQSALIAIAQFRRVNYGAIVYGGDDLSKEIWDDRRWKSRDDIREGLFHICADILLDKAE